MQSISGVAVQSFEKRGEKAASQKSQRGQDAASTGNRELLDFAMDSASFLIFAVFVEFEARSGVALVFDRAIAVGAVAVCAAFGAFEDDLYAGYIFCHDFLSVLFPRQIAA